MPVLLFFRDPNTFPTGNEIGLLNLVVSRVEDVDRDIVLSWSVLDLGQSKQSFPNVHLTLDWPFRGIDPFTLHKAAEMIAAEIAYCANVYGKEIQLIETCLTNKVDGRSYDVTLRRQPKKPNDPREQWLFPIPNGFTDR